MLPILNSRFRFQGLSEGQGCPQMSGGFTRDGLGASAGENPTLSRSLKQWLVAGVGVEIKGPLVHFQVHSY
jgi:hypothetical protein